MKTRFFIQALVILMTWLLAGGQRSFAQQVADQITYEAEASEGCIVVLNGTSHIIVYNLPFSFTVGESLQRVKLWVAGFRIVDGKRYRTYDTDPTEAAFRVEATRRSVDTMQAGIKDLKVQLNALASQPDATSPEVFDQMIVIYKKLCDAERLSKELE